MSRREAPFVQFAMLVRDLCQFRRGPEDMPYSKLLFGLLVAASVMLDLLTGSYRQATSKILARSLVSTSLVLALCWIALSIRHVGNRYVQTASALVACSIVFTLLILPLAWLAGPMAAPPAHLTPLQVLVGWGMIAVVLWNLAV